MSQQNGDEYKARIKRIEKKVDNIHSQIGALIQINIQIHDMMGALGQVAAKEMSKSGILLADGSVPEFKLE